VSSFGEGERDSLASIFRVTPANRRAENKVPQIRLSRKKCLALKKIAGRVSS
jgi:hypothetical protein